MRKYVFDFWAQKRYLSQLQKKNECVRQRLMEYRFKEEEERLAREEKLIEVGQ